jgi:hypothetical protein
LTVSNREWQDKEEADLTLPLSVSKDCMLVLKSLARSRRPRRDCALLDLYGRKVYEELIALYDAGGLTRVKTVESHSGEYESEFESFLTVDQKRRFKAGETAIRKRGRGLWYDTEEERVDARRRTWRRWWRTHKATTTKWRVKDKPLR